MVKRRIDLTGQTFGHLFVLKRSGIDRHGNALYLVRCVIDNCGNEKVVPACSLISGSRKDCGCVNVNDLTGKTFGHLFILKRVGSDKHTHQLYLMRCDADDCGNVIEARGDRLTAKPHPMTHCGCLTSKHRGDAQRGILNRNYEHGLTGTPEYCAEKTHKRRIKKRNNNAGSNLSYAETFKIDRPKLDYCVYCGSTDKPSIDHIIPIDKGGTQDHKNLIRACRSCNSAKNDSFFIDWYIKTKRCKRSLTEIIVDMNFDSIFHLQHYQDSMCHDYYEKNRSSVVAKILKAEKKSIKLLNRYYQSLDNYPTH